MNILVISSLLPYPFDNGALARLYNLYRRLGKKHRLTWASPIWAGTEANISGAKQFCHEVLELPQTEERPLPNRGWRGWLKKIVAHLHWERLFVYCFGYVNAPGIYWLIPSPARVDLINQVASRSNFDLVICEFEGVAELATDLASVPKVIATHNILSVLFRRIRQRYAASWEDRLFYWPELVKIIQYEKHNYSRFNLAIAVSADDRDVLQQRCPALPVAVVPNGVDINHYHPSDAQVDPQSFVYVGNYSYPPNRDAIRYFCREIFPLIRHQAPDARLIAVGLEPPQEILNLDGVQATGFVPDIRPYLAQAGAVIVPLRVGGGTRLKILDALAMGKPIVSTTVGAEGIEVTHGENILLADRPQEFADCVVRLIKQPELRAQLGKNGRQLAEQKYDWDILAEQLDRSLEQVVNDFRAGYGGRPSSGESSTTRMRRMSTSVSTSERRQVDAQS